MGAFTRAAEDGEEAEGLVAGEGEEVAVDRAAVAQGAKVISGSNKSQP